MYDVKPVHEPDQLEQIYRLRVAAWRARVPHFPAMEKWTDDYDNIADHWAIWINDEPVAAARLTIHGRLSQVPNAEVFQSVFSAHLTGPIAVLTRLVVRSSHANLGLSKLLDEVRISHAAGAGCQCIIGSTYAGQKRLAAMQALGFEIVGEAEPYQSGPLRDVAIGGARDRLNHADSLILRLVLPGLAS